MKPQPKQRNEPRDSKASAPTPTSPAAGPAPDAPSAGGGLFLKWFFSRTVRHALQMRRHVWKLVQHQRDLLSPPALEALHQSMAGMRSLCASGDKAAIQAGMEELEKTANKWLKPYPSASLRENIEVLLVAIAVAMAIRTFFLQPFKIPTGSMQPTLWGITSNPDYMHPDVVAAEGRTWDDLRPKPDFEMPNFFKRFGEYWAGAVSYVHVVAKAPGELRAAGKPFPPVLISLWQTFQVGDATYTVWFPPEDMLQRAGLIMGGMPNPKVFKQGEDIIKMRSVSGDHLFVDRLSYNFRKPTRGEIVVFETRHIQDRRVPPDQFYIKRLVGLGGETLKINPDRHLAVNGQELTVNTPHFENLYSFDPKHEPPANHYWGHGPEQEFANQKEFTVPPKHYVVMGDNTRNSLDSRYWGAFPQEDVIGKACFVYWPVSSRFGLGYR
jgi:signal peptidase I